MNPLSITPTKNGLIYEAFAAGRISKSQLKRWTRSTEAKRRRNRVQKRMQRYRRGLLKLADKLTGLAQFSVICDYWDSYD